MPVGGRAGGIRVFFRAPSPADPVRIPVNASVDLAMAGFRPEADLHLVQNLADCVKTN
jgi:hypothetical protein